MELNRPPPRVPVAMAGSVPVVGQTASVNWGDDVEGLLVSSGNGTLTVWRTSPAGIDVVLVATRQGRFPRNPRDVATPGEVVRSKQLDALVRSYEPIAFEEKGDAPRERPLPPELHHDLED